MSVSPSDRNPINAYIDGGIVFAGLVPQRPGDKFGASVIYARFSDSVRAFDRDKIAFTGIPGVVRDYEANLELTYQAQIVPGWTVQPILHPRLASERRRQPQRAGDRRALAVAVLSRSQTSKRVQPSGSRRSCGRKRAL